LHASHVGEINPRAIVHRKALEKGRILARRLHKGAFGFMFMALTPASTVLSAGQLSTHKPQPVQSST
jgi:hypothetical protein